MSQKKVRIAVPGSFIRFQTPEEIRVLRKILGLSVVYGKAARPPTLKDGNVGSPLDRHTEITFVNGTNYENDDARTKVHARSCTERVDILWQPFSCRVVACYGTYVYQVDRCGNLTESPPTMELHQLLHGTYSALDNEDNCLTNASVADIDLEDEELVEVFPGCTFEYHHNTFLIDQFEDYTRRYVICGVVEGPLLGVTVNGETKKYRFAIGHNLRRLIKQSNT